MNNLINWLENSFAPKMNKFNHNTWVVTIKDSIMQVLPFILLGSLFCVGTVIEGFVTLPFSFWTPYGWTMGMISVLAVSYTHLDVYKRQHQRLFPVGVFFLQVSHGFLQLG